MRRLAFERCGENHIREVEKLNFRLQNSYNKTYGMYPNRWSDSKQLERPVCGVVTTHLSDYHLIRFESVRYFLQNLLHSPIQISKYKRVLWLGIAEVNIGLSCSLRTLYNVRWASIPFGITFPCSCFNVASNRESTKTTEGSANNLATLHCSFVISHSTIYTKHTARSQPGQWSLFA